MFENLKKIFCEYWKLRLFKLQCIGSKVKKIGELRYVFSTKRSYLDYMTKKAYLISRWCDGDVYVILTIILMLGVWPCPLGIWLPSDRWRNAGKKSSSCPQGVAEPPRAVLLGLEPNFSNFDFLNPLMKLLRLMANQFWARSRSRLDSKKPKPGDGKKNRLRNTSCHTCNIRKTNQCWPAAELSEQFPLGCDLIFSSFCRRATEKDW